MSAIPYDLAKIKAVIFDMDGVLSANVVPMDADGMPVRTIGIKDGYALHLAVKTGLEVAVISGGIYEPVRRRLERMGLQHVYLGAFRKTEVLESYLKEVGLDASEVAYMGDDIPDYEVMLRVGLPCCPADASPEIKAISKYVSPFRGGEGCGRDLLEQILKRKGIWRKAPEAFVW